VARKQPPKVREIWTVFDELFTHAAEKFRRERPGEIDCREMLEDLIVALRTYEDSLRELIANDRANALHNTLPTGYPMRISRESYVI